MNSFIILVLLVDDEITMDVQRFRTFFLKGTILMKGISLIEIINPVYII